MNNKVLIDALSSIDVKTPPIWLMRQAGRYLPEYRAIRGGISKFLDLCYNPELSSIITMQPILRFNFDAAILFADILVIPNSLGINVRFETGDGPILDTVRDETKLKELKISENNWQFEKIWETASLTKASLPKNVALIGFAGAPWTVATYMLEGKTGTSSNFKYSKNIAKNNPEFLDRLINIITEQTIPYLIGQIDAGVEVIQIFDSWASILDYKEYKRFVEEPTKNIVLELRKQRPNVKIICFPKGIDKTLEEYRVNVRPDAISIGSNISMEKAKSIQKSVVVQGNLDPITLTKDKETIQKETEAILSNLAGRNFIFNLGHGILPETPIENVEFLVELIRNYGKNSSNII
jgi:uroporphyrinogen decarboxylase